MTTRVAVLGGTFDPIHQAHLLMAEGALKVLGLESVYFLISRTPPHKTVEALTPPWHRLAMTALATADQPRFIPCALELESEGSPYTIDALDRFCPLLPFQREQLVFVAGSDSLRDFHHWRRWEELLARYQFVFVERPGVDPAAEAATQRVIDATREEAPRIRQLLREGRRSLRVDLGTPDISSTRLRLMLQSQQDCSRWIPESVSRYIKKVDLYGGK